MGICARARFLSRRSALCSATSHTEELLTDTADRFAIPPDPATVEAAGSSSRLDAGSVLVVDGLVDDELREELLAEITQPGRVRIGMLSRRDSNLVL